MEDAIIISDLHLGSQVCQVELLIDFLEQIKNGSIQTKKLIVNGDIFNSWDFRRLTKRHFAVLSSLRSLSDRIHIIRINGNHDGPADNISHILGLDFVEEFIFTSGKSKVLVLHGDQYDHFITNHPILTWIADLGYVLLQKLDKSFVLARQAKRTSKIFLRCSDVVEAKAKEYAAKQGCNIVCCGHTHLEISHPGEVSYYNSGCWTERPCSFLRIKDGSIQLDHFGAGT